MFLCFQSGGDDIIVVTYLPDVIGQHMLYLTHKNKDIPGTPLSFMVDKKPESVPIFGQGLTRGVVGVPSTFYVFVGGYGIGLLRVTVEGAAEAKITFSENEVSVDALIIKS